MSHTNCSSEFFISSSRSINFTLLQSRNKSMCCVRFLPSQPIWSFSRIPSKHIYRHSDSDSIRWESHCALFLISLRASSLSEMVASALRCKSVVRLDVSPGETIYVTVSSVFFGSLSTISAVISTFGLMWTSAFLENCCRRRKQSNQIMARGEVAKLEKTCCTYSYRVSVSQQANQNRFFHLTKITIIGFSLCNA